MKAREQRAQAPGRGTAEGDGLAVRGRPRTSCPARREPSHTQSPTPSMAREATAPSLPPALPGSPPMAGQPSVTFCPMKVAPTTQLS